jgi:4-amino-4-deoxy-L-arabinose transferase-like glycosyltransferase
MKAARVAALALASVPFIHQLGRWPLIEPDEGRNAEIAREMLASGHWSLPHFDGLPFLDKPPALFWMIAASFRALGVNELGARLPSALAAMVLVAVTVAIGNVLVGSRPALRAGVVLATSPIVLVFARLTIFDMPFTALVVTALWCLLRARLDGRPGVWLAAAGCLMGLATLTKGPVGIAVPLVAWLAGRGALPASDRSPGRWSYAAGVVAFVLVVGPWLLLVTRQEPGFLRYALVDETFLRFTSAARFHRGGPIYYHAAGLALGLGVWTLLLAAALPALVRRGAGDAREARAIRFLARSAGAVLLFFSVCASKRPGYILPAMAPASLLVAIGIAAEPGRTARMLRGVALVLVAAGCAMFAARARVRIPSLDDDLVRAALAAMATCFVGWGALALWALRGRPRAAFATAAALAPMLYAMLLGPLTGYAEGRSARGLARAIAPDAEVMALGTFRTSLPFYLGRPVVLASLTGQELTSNYVTSRRERFLADGSLWRPRALRRRLNDGAAACVLMSTHTASRLIPVTPRPVRIVASDRRSLVVTSADAVVARR